MKTIIEMAREAGFEVDEDIANVWVSDGYIGDQLERFARLAQSKRPWVGLTEDEVAQAMYRADAIVTGPMQFKFAKELEAKLKEKNT